MNKLLLSGIITLVIAMGIGRFSYTVILPYMQSEAGLSHIQAGYLATWNYLGYFLGATAAGMYTFRNKRRMVLSSLIVSIVTTLGMGWTEHFLVWAALRLLSGIASAFAFVSAAGIIMDELMKRRKVHLTGAMYSGPGLGIALSAAVAAPFYHWQGWNGAWFGMGIVSLLLFPAVWLWMRTSNTPRGAAAPLPAEVQRTGSLRQLPPRPWYKWLLLSYGLEGLGYIVTGTFIVSIAEESAFFQGNAALVWLAVGLAAAPSCIIWARLGARFGLVHTLFAAMLLQAAGVLLPVLLHNSAALYVSAVMFGGTFMGITTLATNVAGQMFPTDKAKLVGQLTAGYALGQMIGPAVAGWAMQATGSYQLALIGASLIIFAGGFSLAGGMGRRAMRQVD